MLVVVSEPERILLYACDAFGTEVAGRGELEAIMGKTARFYLPGRKRSTPLRSPAPPQTPSAFKNKYPIQLTSSYPNAKKEKEKTGYEVKNFNFKNFNKIIPHYHYSSGIKRNLMS